MWDHCPRKKWNTNWYTSRACLTNTTPIHPLSPPVCRQTGSSFSVEPFNNTITLLCVASSSKTVDWWLASNQGKPAAEIPSIQSYGHHPQVLDPVILSADNAIQWINCFPADERNILPLLTGESVSSGWHYLPFRKLGPSLMECKNNKSKLTFVINGKLIPMTHLWQLF